MTTNTIPGALETGHYGAGNLNTSLVTKRARELALIDGNLDDEPPRKYFLQAEDELSAEVYSEESQIPMYGATGHVSYEKTEEQKLYEQGIDEAVHSEMLESAREVIGVDGNKVDAA